MSEQRRNAWTSVRIYDAGRYVEVSDIGGGYLGKLFERHRIVSVVTGKTRKDAQREAQEKAYALGWTQ